MSTHDEAPPLHPHVRLDELATGALSPEERRIAEAHVAECAECRAELESIRRLQAGLRRAYDAQPGPSLRARNEVHARIGAGEARGTPSARVVSIDERRRERTARWSLPRWAQVAAIALIVVQGGLLLRPFTQPAAPSDRVGTRAVAQPSPRLRVVFAPSATDAEIRALLASLDARIVDGPSPAGEYRIELRDAAPNDVAAKLRAARERRDVLQSVDLAP